MNVASLQKVALALAESQTVDSVLQIIVRSLAEQSNVALARVWLKEPGDICRTRDMRISCHDQRLCLHLVASAGNPLNSSGPNSWTRTDGNFRFFDVSELANHLHSAQPPQRRVTRNFPTKLVKQKGRCTYEHDNH
jgi:hypothetical protein